MTFYSQVKEKTKNKARDKRKKQKAKPKSDFVDEIKAGAGVFAVDGKNVQRGTGGELMPTWVQGNARYHINLQGGDRDDVYHVTREGHPRIHYFFTGTGNDIVGVHPNKTERGKSKQKDPETGDLVPTKRSFDDLPADVQKFVRENWDAIFG